MFWVWLRILAEIFFWLIIPPKNRRVIPSISPNEICPACGNTEGHIRCIPRDTENASVAMGVVIQHTCKICGAHWHTQPVTKDANEFVYP